MVTANYPEAPRSDGVENLGGSSVADPYRWLEDPDSPQTQAWSGAQDALYETYRDSLPARDTFQNRLREFTSAGSISAPAWRGDRQFIMRRSAEQEHAVLLILDADGTERVLLNPMDLDPSGTTTLDSWQPSKEGDLLAYQLSHGGTEESVLWVMDVATGTVVDGPIDRARYSPIAWLPGGKEFYYVRRLAPDLVPAGEQQFHRRVWLHRMGTNANDDTMIFGEGLTATNYYGCSVSLDGRWLVISAAEGTAPRNDTWLADISASPRDAPALSVVQQGVDAQTSVSIGRDGVLYVMTNQNAPLGSLHRADPTSPTQWEPYISAGHNANAVMEDYAILDGEELSDRPLIAVAWTRHTVSEVSIHDLATGERLETLDLPGVGSVGGLASRPTGGHELWFGYTDHVTPGSVWRYDALSGEVTKYADPPGSVVVPAVSVRQVTYTSADGTQVRMFVIAPKDSVAGPPAARPTILYGYGGFGLSLGPAYGPAILAWVEAGGVYAIANIRGGGEEGEQWHRDGMLGAKQNVFDDFHAAAEWLIHEGWTTAEQLGISGGSNGGLLVGAALVQRPELYASVVCSAPLLDMVRYEKFGLGATWNVEYGSAADPIQLEWLLKYSPYHQVREGVEYPAVLFTVFDGDSRVDPLHARKMCAALQHASAGLRPIFLRREHDVGHGARAVSRGIALSAEVLAFSAAQLHLGVRGFDTSGAHVD
jgi:prolyl oligopeptidase